MVANLLVLIIVNGYAQPTADQDVCKDVQQDVPHAHPALEVAPVS